jgi:hypothetical protein
MAKAPFTLLSVTVTGIIFVGGQLLIRIFLLCIPLLSPFPAVNNTGATLVKTNDLLCFQSQDILLLKGTKHQLSVHGKMVIVNGFSKACVTFSSVSAIFKKDVLKYKRNRIHKVTHINKYR